MVESGQGGPRGQRGDILPVAFRNPSRPASTVEVLRLARILQRALPGTMDRLQRLEFHLVVLFLAGRCVHTVDFEPVQCERGTLLHVLPGQVQRWSITRGLDAVALIFTPDFLLPERPRAGALWGERLFEDAALPTALRFAGADRDAAEAVDDTPVSRGVVRHLVAAVLLDLARRQRLGARASEPASPERERVRRIVCRKYQAVMLHDTDPDPGRAPPRRAPLPRGAARPRCAPCHRRCPRRATQRRWRSCS